jgi:two-component system CheB/CheR fusion protein
MPNERDTVYVIDPDEGVHDAITTLLGANGTRVACYPNAEAFFDSTCAHSLSRGCLLVEANLPGMGSLAFLRRLRAQGVDLPVLVLTSTSNREIANQALKAGAVEVIEKPLVGGRLLNRLRHLARRNDDARME